MDANQIIEQFWINYINQNPHAKRVYDLFIAEGETVVNDHIAFRTFDDPRIQIDKLAKLFLKNGYIEKQAYDFPLKHLHAKHYEHEDGRLPKIFISELKLNDFDAVFRQTITSFIDKIPKHFFNTDDLLFHGNLWGLPSYHLYNELRNTSEYASWLLVNGFRANHFTISVNSLKKYNTIDKVNSFLKEHNFKLNDFGGETKGSQLELLEQSSIKAGKKRISFTDGVHEVPTCYYEFALRYPDEDGNLFSGFVVKSADKIFESTNH